MSIWNAGPSANYDAEQIARTSVFIKIQPRDNWKNPINAWIDESDFADCNQAAIWFTGAGLTVIARNGEKLHVTAPGYYLTIGA